MNSINTATSAYILARQLGGDAELLAAIITGDAPGHAHAAVLVETGGRI